MTRSLPAVLGFVLFLGVCSVGWADPPEWRKAADERIEKVRKGDFVVRVLDPQTRPVTTRPVTVRLVRHHFGFGTAVGPPQAYDYSWRSRNFYGFVVDHFSWIVPENAMKWGSCEPEMDKVSFDGADRLMAFAKANQLKVRGHCLFWGRKTFMPKWTAGLDAAALRKQAEERLDGIVPRYKGQLVAWDVNNEMLSPDGFFMEDRLGEGTYAWMFKRAAELDPGVKLFINEYELIGRPDRIGQLENLVRRLREQGAVIGGIGIQAHGAHRLAPAVDADQNDPKPPKDVPIRGHIPPEEMVASLDRIGELGVPIHLTEVSFPSLDENRQAEALDTFFRIAFSHPKVEALLLWGFMEDAHWTGARGGLFRKDFSPKPAGKALLRLLDEEWRTTVSATPDAEGVLRFRGFYGVYEVSSELDGKRQVTTVELLPDRLEATARLGARHR